MKMFLMYLIGLVFFGGFLLLMVGSFANYMDYKQESEMGARLGDTLNGRPPERAKPVVKDWVQGLRKLGIEIADVETYESELRRDLRELMNVTLPEIAKMDIGLEMKVEYGGVIRREVDAVIERAKREKTDRVKSEIDYLVGYGLGEKAKK
ncbi:hypothetical protein EVJ32_04615 [Exiguobacterium sp. SH5S4]|uniref:hypothetical protein n=1 Tax=Exiguobacterium sp. SH5S4 TaxID=2510961 RepID=UPI0010E336BD|nr:hypothetical protein [Exiguobacterium sp. SH5S4]TCI26660.1 hypothetical protein EVJ32_04615 [Exiguobacterium sp. SH5S4]